MLAFVWMTHSITSLPAAFRTAIEILSLCTSIPIYLVLVIKGRSSLDGLRQAPKPYSTRGALLYCVRWSQWVDATLNSNPICTENKGQNRWLRLGHRNTPLLRF